MKLFHFFFLVFTVSLCIASIFVFTGIYIAQQVGYGSALEALKLPNAPEKFIVLESPDQYVIRALSNPSTSVFVDLDKTLIDNIIQSNGTNNVFYENSYYEINVVSVDPACFDFFGPLIITWIIWGIVASVLAIFSYKKKSKAVR
jgi:hypothetical protein